MITTYLAIAAVVNVAAWIALLLVWLIGRKK